MTTSKLSEEQEALVIAINVVLGRGLLDLSSFTLEDKYEEIQSMDVNYYGKNEDMIKALTLLKKLSKDKKVNILDIK